MNAPASWGLIGYGNIGREIMRQIGQPAVAKRLGLNLKPMFIIESRGIMQPDGVTPSPHQRLAEITDLPAVTFIAIPSSDDGKIAYEYITGLLQKGKFAVTAEKGALANYYPELKIASNDFRRFGITAAVGGGTRLLHVAKQYCQDIDNITQIHLVLNGTLAAIMDWVAPISGPGIAFSEAAKKAVEQGFAEPGSNSAAAIIRTEAEGDIPKKLSIFYNAVGISSQLVDWNDLRFSLSDDQIAEAVNPETPRRFIVSLYPASNQNQFEDDVIGGFRVNHDGWELVGGFRRVNANPLFAALTTLTGPGNGMVIGLGPEANDGVYAVTGPGAGVSPTVNTMLDDYLRLTNREAN